MITSLKSLATAVALLVAVGGCASQMSAPAGAGASAPAPAAAGVAPGSDAPERVEFRVVDGEVEGGATRITVERGTPVVLVVTADRADEAHLHGYDRAVALQPDRPAEVRFTADVPGSFEFELHGSGALLARIEVR